MGNRQLNAREIMIIRAQTNLDLNYILKAFEKFKRLAGDKGYVNVNDLTQFLADYPFAQELLAVCVTPYPKNKCGDLQEVDFLQLLVVIVAMKRQDGETELKVLFRMFD